MYKDKDKQREADKERQRRYRANRGLKAYPRGVTSQGVTGQGVTQYPQVSDQDFTKLLTHDASPEHIRVTKPGDADYEPQCETTKAFVEGRPKVESESKRGRDIKTFEDLPPDVQQTIKTVSESNEEFQRRTVIAIAYQHTFPERY
jgi:hypothetical protein